MNRITEYLRAPLLVAVLVLTAACASSTKHEGTAEYADDTYITGKVKAAILAEPNLKSSEINVETYKGAVQLSGFVRSSEMATRAVEVTRQVGGVKSISNDMRIK